MLTVNQKLRRNPLSSCRNRKHPARVHVGIHSARPVRPYLSTLRNRCLVPQPCSRVLRNERTTRIRRPRPPKPTQPSGQERVSPYGRFRFAWSASSEVLEKKPARPIDRPNGGPKEVDPDSQGEEKERRESIYSLGASDDSKQKSNPESERVDSDADMLQSFLHIQILPLPARHGASKWL